VSNKKVTLLSILAFAAWILYVTNRNHKEVTTVPTTQSELAKNIGPDKSIQVNATHSVLGFEVDKDPNVFKMIFKNSPGAKELTQELKFTMNPNARKVDFSEVLYFLNQNSSHKRDYVLDDYDCKHFAHRLISDAQKKGIKSYFVAIKLQNKEVGHAIAAFETSDWGMVFVDFTPASQNAKSKYQRNLIWLEEGERFLSIPLEELGMSFRYEKRSFESFHAKRFALQMEAQNINSAYMELQSDVNKYNQEMQIFSRRIQYINQNRTPVNQQLKNEIQAKQEELNEIRQELEDRQAELEDQRISHQDEVQEVGINTSDWVVESFQFFPNYAAP